MAAPLSVIDRLFLHLEEPAWPMHVGALQLLEVPRATCESAFAEGLYDDALGDGSVTPPFDRVAVTSARGVRWREHVRVDLKRHIFVHHLAGSDARSTLTAAACRLHEVPLDRSKPLWEVHILSVEGSGLVGIYYKMHHACIDGVAGIRRLQRSAARSAEERSVWPFRLLSPARPHPNGARTGALSRTQVARELTQELLAVARQALGVESSASRLPFTCPPSLFNRHTGPRRRLSCVSIPLSACQEVAHALDATVNDIVLAMTAGALREYLASRRSLPEHPLVGFVPVSLRDQNVTGEGNQVASLYCDLATDSADPLARLRRIQASAEAGKKRVRRLSRPAAEALSVSMVAPMIAAQALGVVRHLPVACNVVVSNVPGPSQPSYVNGARMRHLYPISALFDMQGLNVTVISCDGMLDFGLLACARTLPDVERIAGLLHRGFDDLASLAALRPPHDATAA